MHKKEEERDAGKVARANQKLRETQSREIKISDNVRYYRQRGRERGKKRKKERE